MQLQNSIENDLAELISIRHNIHAHPESAYEEHKTAALVTQKLKTYGYTLQTGIAQTGIIATLKCGESEKSIALRADMDALNMQELNSSSYTSTHKGKMHACGHDGHTTILLGAAKQLASRKNFNGTLHLIFQPAEENECGAKRMIEEGLFKRISPQSIYALHNWPDLEAGKIAIKKGPIMASCDFFDISIEGKGAHAAMPHKGVNPLSVASTITEKLSTLSRQSFDPFNAHVITVTQIHGGDTYNVIPQHATLRGTVRTFDSNTQTKIEQEINHLATTVASSFHAKATLSYHKEYTPTINTYTKHALQAAKKVFKEENIIRDFNPSMGAEDFGYMLEKVKGCYVWLGAKKEQNNAPLHSPYYDFNDEIIKHGVAFFTTLIETELEKL